jgi:hypothetical protein
MFKNKKKKKHNKKTNKTEASKEWGREKINSFLNHLTLKFVSHFKRNKHLRKI